MTTGHLPRMKERMATHTMAVPGALEPADLADEAAWDALYREQMPRIYNFFRYRVGPGPEAEDLTAITFEKAWRHRQRYRRDLASFATWLFAIARNVARDHYRSRRRQVPLDAVADVASGECTEAEAERRSDASHLATLIHTLSDRDRELISLKYGAEFSNREIAELTGLTASNVGTILHRAITRLQEEWPKE